MGAIILKFNLNNKYIKAGATALAVIVLALLFNYRLEHKKEYEQFLLMITNTFFPIVIGFTLAYLENPVLNFFESIAH